MWYPPRTRPIFRLYLAPFLKRIPRSIDSSSTRKGHTHLDMDRRDRDAGFEIAAKGVAEQTVAMLEEYHSSNREQAASSVER